MYWTAWGTAPYIKHAKIDGSNPKIIVQADLGWPNALAIDTAGNRIFWADAQLDKYVRTEI